MQVASLAGRAYPGPAMAGRRPSKGTSVFGDRLARFRKEQGLSQKALADRVGVSQQMVAYYETNATSPAVDVAQRCAEALGVPLSMLVDKTKPVRVRPGPRSHIEERIEKLRKLPRKQQELVLRMLDAALESASKG